MKKIFYITLISLFFVNNTFSQKFAYIDSDYILNKIPEFKQAQDKLDALSAEWQKEIEKKFTDVENMYKSYQQEQILLTKPMKNKEKKQ